MSGKETSGEEQIDPSLLCEVNGRSVLAAREQALRVLQGELSPGSTQTYLATGRQVVKAPRPYIRDCLRERVGKRLKFSAAATVRALAAHPRAGSAFQR